MYLKRNEHKIFFIIFCWRLEGLLRKEKEPDPLVKGKDPMIWIPDPDYKMPRIRNIESNMWSRRRGMKRKGSRPQATRKRGSYFLRKGLRREKKNTKIFAGSYTIYTVHWKLRLGSYKVQRLERVNSSIAGYSLKLSIHLVFLNGSCTSADIFKPRHPKSDLCIPRN